MKDENNTGKKDLVREQVKRRAQEAAKDLVRFLSHKARQDVDGRLKYLDKDRFADDDLEHGPVCGTRLQSSDGLERGLYNLFARYSADAKAAIIAEEFAKARELLGGMMAMPLDALPQLRNKVISLYRKVEALEKDRIGR